MTSRNWDTFWPPGSPPTSRVLLISTVVTQSHNHWPSIPWYRHVIYGRSLKLNKKRQYILKIKEPGIRTICIVVSFRSFPDPSPTSSATWTSSSSACWPTLPGCWVTPSSRTPLMSSPSRHSKDWPWPSWWPRPSPTSRKSRHLGDNVTNTKKLGCFRR